MITVIAGVKRLFDWLDIFIDLSCCYSSSFYCIIHNTVKDFKCPRPKPANEQKAGTEQTAQGIIKRKEKTQKNPILNF